MSALRDVSARVLAPAWRPIPPRLRVVDERTRRREQKFRRTAVLFSTFSVIALLAAVIFHVEVAQLQFQIEETERDIAHEQQQYKDLRLQMAELTSPERIMAEAQERGLVSPGQVTYVSGGADTMLTASEQQRAEWEEAEQYLDDSR